MTLELLANAFVFGSDDPARRSDVLDAMRRSRAFSSVYQDGRWCVGEAAFPVGPRQPAEAAPHGLLLTQAPASLYESPGELARLADLLSHRPERAGDLAGDVGAVHLDGATAHLMRPAAGRVPWYYTVDATECAVGTRLAYFHHLLRMSKADEFVHAALTGAQIFPDERAPIAGVRLLAPGHVVTLRPRAQPKPIAYWHPFAVERTRPTAASVRDHAVELRRRLVAALERELDPDGGNLLELTGGLDSVSVAALAVRAAGRPVGTFTRVAAAGDARRADVLGSVEPLTTALRIAPTTVLDPLTAPWGLEAQWIAPRIGLAMPRPTFGHLRRLVTAGDWTVLTGGDLADDLIGGSLALPYDWMASLSMFQLASRLRKPGTLDLSRSTVARMWSEQRRRWLTGRPALPVASALPDFVLEQHRREYTEWRTAFTRRIARVGHPYPRLQAVLECDAWQVVNWEACSALGVRRSTPFVTRDVIELAVACHPQEHAEPPQRLLRDGLSGDLPPQFLERSGRGDGRVEADPDVAVPWDFAVPERVDGIVRGDWVTAPPKRLPVGHASSLLGVIVGTDAPLLVPTRLRVDAEGEPDRRSAGPTRRKAAPAPLA